MARIRRKGPAQRERWRHELDLDQELGFVLGPAGDGFASEDEARSAWGLHRERIRAEHPNGSRPAAWWAFEAREPQPSRADRDLPPGWSAEAVALAQRGELSADEFRALARRARRVGSPRAWEPERLDSFLHEMQPGQGIAGGRP